MKYENGECQMTDEEKYLINLGKLMSNFWTLEFVLRVFLYELNRAKPSGLHSKTEINTFPFGSELPVIDIYSFQIGSKLPKNELTDYSQLRNLIADFNNEMESRNKPKIDPTLVNIRDALAHGRASSKSINGTMHLLKFGPPKNDKVQVVFNEALSREWFQRQIERTNKACQLVIKIKL